MKQKIKLFRISTVPTTMESLLNDQLRMVNEHYEVVAVSSPGKEMQVLREREGIRTIEVPMERRISPIKDFISLIRMIRVFIKERPYMVHSMTPKAGLISMLAGWITRVPVRMHTFTGLVFPTATGWKQRLLMCTDRLTCACATHVNPEGEGVKRDLMTYGITKKPLQIIGNGSICGVDMDYFDRTEAVRKQAATYREEGCFTFCFVGRIVRDKGINELVSAFVRLHQQYSQVRLLLVGPFEKKLDPVLPDTEKAIQEHSAIRFMGFQPDVRPFLVASDALVLPSYREGFPNVVLQAGAMGLPSIVTNINGSNEIILPNENGVIIPSKDEEALYQAMENFLLHPEEVERMAKKARPLIASRYDRKVLWKALLKAYKRLIDNQIESF